MTSSALHENTETALELADTGPLLITAGDKPSHVLVSYDEFERLRRPFVSVVDAIADRRPEADFEWKPPARRVEVRKIDFD